MRTIRKGGINRHEKITQVLLSGKIVSPEEIRACFTGTDQEKVLYRLPTNIYNIKKDGGIIRVHKNGRNVIGYQLLNADEFNANGRYVGPQPKVVENTAPATVEVTNTETPETQELEEALA